MYKILKAEKLAEKIFLMDVEAPKEYMLRIFSEMDNGGDSK